MGGGGACVGKQPSSTESRAGYLPRARDCYHSVGGCVRVSDASFLALSYPEVMVRFVNILLILQLGFLFIHLI